MSVETNSYYALKWLARNTYYHINEVDHTKWYNGRKFLEKFLSQKDAVDFISKMKWQGLVVPVKIRPKNSNSIILQLQKENAELKAKLQKQEALKDLLPGDLWQFTDQNEADDYSADVGDYVKVLSFDGKNEFKVLVGSIYYWLNDTSGMILVERDGKSVE